MSSLSHELRSALEVLLPSKACRASTRKALSEHAGGADHVLELFAQAVEARLNDAEDGVREAAVFLVRAQPAHQLLEKEGIAVCALGEPGARGGGQLDAPERLE